MRIAWVTPLSHESAVGEYSVNLCAALARVCEVELWAADEPPWQRASVPLVDARDADGAGLEHHDAVVYNFGNSHFHRGVYELSRRRPGIALLHDRVYWHFFLRQWSDPFAGERRFGERLRAFYGDDAELALERIAQTAAAGVRITPEDALRFPLYEELIAGAVGVLVHAADQAAEIGRSWLGPVGRVHFPVYDRWWTDADGDSARRTRETADDTLTLLSVGYITPNRPVDRVLELLARDAALRERLRYVVLGPVGDGDYVRRLQRLVAQHRLDDRVELVLGYQPEEVLQGRLAAADAYVNLREPALEGASASFLQELARGKPIVASATGFMAEAPEEAFLRVSDDASLSDALRTLVSDPSRRRALGERAQAYARTLTSDRAAAEVVELCERALEWRPLLALTRRLGEEAARMRAGNDVAVLNRLARALAPLIDP